MSRSMDMTAGPVGDIAPPSNNRWWAIAAGIGLAAVLGYGAALVATDHLPGTGPSVAAPMAAVATPQVENEAVAQSALDPLDEPLVPSQTQAAVGAGGGLSQQEVAGLVQGSGVAQFWHGVYGTPELSGQEIVETPKYPTSEVR